MIPRRGLLAGLGALLAAPAIIRTPGLLMPVRTLVEAKPVLDAAEIQALADALGRELSRGMSEAIAEMNRMRLARVRFLTGTHWTDDDVARMRRVG